MEGLAPRRLAARRVRTSLEVRRHLGEATKGEEEDVTPDLLLKHPDATLATLKTCV